MNSGKILESTRSYKNIPIRTWCLIWVPLTGTMGLSKCQARAMIRLDFRKPRRGFKEQKGYSLSQRLPANFGIRSALVHGEDRRPGGVSTPWLFSLALR